MSVLVVLVTVEPVLPGNVVVCVAPGSVVTMVLVVPSITVVVVRVVSGSVVVLVTVWCPGQSS
jgi:hypothetical protein